MKIADPKIRMLRENVKVAQQELEIAITFHEVWKPSAYDEELHKRMGVSYATNAFDVVRHALRRETLLALMRLWDKDRKAVGLERIAENLRDKAVVDALVGDRATRIGIRNAEESIRESLQEKANAAIAIIEKYSNQGSHFPVRRKLRTLRNEFLAHRQLKPSASTARSATDEEVETFYRDMCELIRLLLSLVEALAYDPLDAADVYRRYAVLFWASVRGERTEGHPSYRPLPT